MTQLKQTFIESVMEGYYINHDKGEALLELDLDNLVNHSVDIIIEKNKRIDYLEQREADLLIELEDARTIIRKQTDTQTHVNKIEG